MSKIKLNKVVLENVKNVGVLVVEKKGVAGTKDDKRTNNPGRPVNKKSARYKRLAKQARYERVLNKFVSGKPFTLKNQSVEYRYRQNADGSNGGSLFNGIGSHECNIDYVGRTKATGYTFVLGRKINVQLNLKTLVFVK